MAAIRLTPVGSADSAPASHTPPPGTEPTRRAALLAGTSGGAGGCYFKLPLKYL